MNPDGSRMVSPEERLLRLIRGSSPSGALAGAPVAQHTQPAAAVGVGPLHRGTRRWHWPTWGLTAVNIGFGVLVAIEAIGLIGLIAAPQPAMLHADLAHLPSQPPTAAIAGTATTTTQVAAPTTFAVSRPLFQPGSGEAAGASASAGATTAAAVRFNLIGVVAGDPPQAIIADAQTTKTYLVTPRQPVVEGWVVESIGQDRVLLDRAGEKLELAL